MNNSVLIQNVSVSDLERIIDQIVEKRFESFYEKICEKPSLMVKRKDAAKMLGLSLPTIDAYGKAGILHPKRIGGRVFYEQEELQKFTG